MSYRTFIHAVLTILALTLIAVFLWQWKQLKTRKQKIAAVTTLLIGALIAAVFVFLS